MALLLCAASTLAAGAAFAQSAPPAAAARGDVVVTGRRLTDTERALAACLARHCPPDEDIAATLAHAENQFVAGRYTDAEATLKRGVGRNHRYAARFPVPVSDLLRATSRVDVHLGEAADYRRTTLDVLGALKAGLPADDPRVIEQRLEVGDMFASVGDPASALDTYRAVIRRAHALGFATLEGAARLHEATLRMQAVADTGTGSKRDALAAMNALAHEPRPELASFAVVARVLLAQYEARHGNPAPMAAAMAEMRARLGGVHPVLLQFDPIRLPGRPDAVEEDGSAPVRDALTRLPVGDFTGQWIDVSFLIKPDGSVDDVVVLRQSKPTVDVWDKPVLASVRSRRYAPLTLPADTPGLLRVERYTYTSFLDETATGTRLPTRDGLPKVEMLDLSDDAPPAGTAPPAVGLPPSGGAGAGAG